VKTLELPAARHERWRNWNNAAETQVLEFEAASELVTSAFTVLNNRFEKARVFLRGALRPVLFVVPAGASRSVALING